MIAILLADGFEEIEALTPLDILKRAGYDARTVAIGSKIAIGSHGISVICDMTADEVNLDEVSLVIFPGGMPGSLNLDKAEFTDKIIAAVVKNGGRIAAICAAPLILGRRGLLEGKHAVCYPGFEEELRGAIIDSSPVVTDGNITTAKGMGVALSFSLELVRLLSGVAAMKELRDSVIYNAAPPKEYSAEGLSPEAIEAISSPLFKEAAELVFSLGEISTVPLQKFLSIGFSRATKILDAMAELGMISRGKPGAPWRVIISKDSYEAIKAKYKI